MTIPARQLKTSERRERMKELEDDIGDLKRIMLNNVVTDSTGALFTIDGTGEDIRVTKWEGLDLLEALGNISESIDQLVLLASIISEYDDGVTDE